MANDKKIDFKVGEKYYSLSFDWECIYIDGDLVYLRRGSGGTAYVWKTDGTAISLGEAYNILPPKPEPIVRWAIIREEDGFHITTFGNRSDAEDGIDLLVGDFKVIKLQEVQE